MSALVISVATSKGGVSKTSTGVFLATALAKQGRKVIYLDCDSQSSAYDYRQFEKANVYDQEIPEPYKIRKTNPTYIFDEVQDYKSEYDIIFIDVPRLTHGERDNQIAAILAMCDAVLIPVKSGELDNISTVGFVRMLREIEAYKKEKNHQYKYAAFLSMAGRRPSDDAEAKEFIHDLKMPFIENELRDVRELSKPYTYESLLETSNAHRERFEPFYNEVVQFFNL